MKKVVSAKRFVSELMLLLATLVMLTPIYYFIISSFKTRMDILQYPLLINTAMFSFDNFVQAFQKIELLQAYKNTGSIFLGSMALTIVCSSIAGFACARIKARSFKLAYTYLVSLLVLPFVGCIIPLVVIVNNLGMMNNLWSCIIIQAGWAMPFATFLYTGFMKGIPGELEEASIIDGCSLFQTYWHIFLPMLKPVTATCIIKLGIGIWNDYLVSSYFLNSAKTPTIMISVKKFYGQYVNEYGQSFAAVVMCSVPLLILFVFLQKYFIKGIAAGAVKG